MMLNVSQVIFNLIITYSKIIWSGYDFKDYISRGICFFASEVYEILNHHSFCFSIAVPGCTLRN